MDSRTWQLGAGKELTIETKGVELGSIDTIKAIDWLAHEIKSTQDKKELTAQCVDASAWTICQIYTGMICAYTATLMSIVYKLEAAEWAITEVTGDIKKLKRAK